MCFCCFGFIVAFKSNFFLSRLLATNEFFWLEDMKNSLVQQKIQQSYNHQYKGKCSHVLFHGFGLIVACKANFLCSQCKA